MNKLDRQKMDQPPRGLIRALFTRHPLLSIHGMILVLLLIGLVQRTGAEFLPHIALYAATLLIVYAGVYKVMARRIPGRIAPVIPKRLFIRWSFLMLLILTGWHWVSLGGIPLWEALHEPDDLEIVAIRRAAGEDLPVYLKYGSHLMIKAVLPIALILAWTVERRLFWLTATIGVIYAMSLLTKSLAITLFVPVWIAFMIGRRWKSFAVLSTAFLLFTVTLSTVANPQKLREASLETEATPVSEHQGIRVYAFAEDAVIAIARRVFLMPGWTVAAWFEHIPTDVPYQQGRAIRPLAKVINEPYVDVTEMIYDLEYPEMAAKQVPGTMGSASFMFGYANFGPWGLVGSGAIIALMLIFAQSCFGAEWRWAVVLNTFPLLALSSSALPTVLVTHGWLATLLLFILLRPKHGPAE